MPAGSEAYPRQFLIGPPTPAAQGTQSQQTNSQCDAVIPPSGTSTLSTVSPTILPNTLAHHVLGIALRDILDLEGRVG
jgi:hypothetical protein